MSQKGPRSVNFPPLLFYFFPFSFSLLDKRPSPAYFPTVLAATAGSSSSRPPLRISRPATVTNVKWRRQSAIGEDFYLTAIFVIGRPIIYSFAHGDQLHNELKDAHFACVTRDLANCLIFGANDTSKDERISKLKNKLLPKRDT